MNVLNRVNEIYTCQYSYNTRTQAYVFKNRIPWPLFGAKCYDVTGQRRKIHNEEFHNFYTSPCIKMIK